LGCAASTAASTSKRTAPAGTANFTAPGGWTPTASAAISLPSAPRPQVKGLPLLAPTTLTTSRHGRAEPSEKITRPARHSPTTLLPFSPASVITRNSSLASPISMSNGQTPVRAESSTVRRRLGSAHDRS
jgi:hypothetical protein